MINLSSIKNSTSEEATILTKNLLFEIDKVNKRFEPQDQKWTNDILDVLKFVVSAGEGLTLGMVYTLYVIRDHWEDMPIGFRKEYDYQFAVLVGRETPIKMETLENYFRTVKTFVIDGKKPFGTVEVVKRDKYKNEIIEEGEVLKEAVEFDPLTVPITKLSLMRAAVENDQMDSKRWSLLVDPGVTVREIQQELYIPKEPNGPDPSLKFRLYGDVIVAEEFGREVVVGRLDFSNWDDELIQRSIKRIHTCLNMKLDIDTIELIKENKFLERAYNVTGDETQNESEREH